jgi:hypothetical protein
MARANTSQDCCVHATSTDAKAAQQFGLTLRFLPGRWIPKQERMRVSVSFVLDRDPTACPANARPMARLRQGE